MSVFADSSALVKLYADEEGWEQIRAQPVLAISEIARVEVCAALWRKHRMGELSLEAVGTLVGLFEGDFTGHATSGTVLLPIALTGDILGRATILVGTNGLRAYDAVQLASAIAVREADPDCGTFAAFDSELRSAAARNGFRLLP